MCGIAGIVGSNNTGGGKIKTMVSFLDHRGPDGKGTYVDNMIELGHSRLAILDLSDAAKQPMLSPEGRFSLVYNGEIYNYKELRSELKDYSFRGTGDTEVVLASYLKWGRQCVRHFIGMFAFAIWDKKERSLFCARDRLGIKPFYYTRSAASFVFASEIRPILAVGVNASPNMSTWTDYLHYGYSDHNQATFFENILCLPPGHHLHLCDNKLTIKEYWSLPEIVADALDSPSKSNFEPELNSILKDSVRLRLRSDVPIGVNLSSGLDSGSLFSLIDESVLDQGNICSFTGCFDDPAYDEGQLATSLSSTKEWNHVLQTFTVEDAWSTFQNLTLIQEAPFGGVASALRYKVAEKAKELDVKVVLQAEGVDELFAGYAYYEPYHYLDIADRYGLREVRRQVPEPRFHSVVKQMESIRAGSDNVYQDGTEFLRATCIREECIPDDHSPPEFRRPFDSYLANRSYQDLKHTKLPRVLRINDKLSMACSIEYREPFLDHRLVEFAFTLPNKQKINGDSTKCLLRKVMKGRLPETVRTRGKIPVVTPQREWLRGPLRENVKTLISDQSFRQRGIFDVQMVEKEYKKFCSETQGNSFFVWQWINTELWFRTFIDSDSSQQLN